MAPVNWDGFQNLPGAPQTNFESICRAVMRIHYGRYGNLVARAAQPGVEFHLKLHASCLLGEAGRWFGWQCRWYTLASGTPLGTARRRKIEDAIRTTEHVLPGMTDWVLWTRFALTKSDQDWFYGLKTQMHLHLWTAAEVEPYLGGEAAFLRDTYFGEWILTPEKLSAWREEAVAPVRQRWLPEVHQVIDAERRLREALGEADSWNSLNMVAQELKEGAKRVLDDDSLAVKITLIAPRTDPLGSKCRRYPFSTLSAIAIPFCAAVSVLRHKLLPAQKDSRAKLSRRPIVRSSKGGTK
jgi:hypothetical protein